MAFITVSIFLISCADGDTSTGDNNLPADNNGAEQNSPPENNGNGDMSDINLKRGDRISVHMELNEDNQPLFYFHGYDRSLPLLFLCLFFMACVIILGRFKGIKALIALTLTVSLVLFGLVPLLLRGYNPIILSILTCILAAVITFSICFGVGKKSISAIIGVIVCAYRNKSP
jgi:uncharacterized membrane protein